MSLTYGELFGGYGGLGMGVQSVLGGDMAWYADVCKFDKNGNAGHYEPHRSPCAILAHHHPDLPNLGDVTKVDWASVEPVDVITGGSPCQDLSHAGKRAGMKAGTRSGLWASMCDAIEIIRPRLVVWENVRGALSAEADSAVEPCPVCVGDERRVTLRALGRVLGDLAELGYDARWYGLRAADVGAAHGRFRVFVFATPADADDSGWGEHRRAVAVRAEQPSTQCAGGDAAAGLTLLPTPAVNDMGAAYTPETWDAWTERMKAEHGNGNGHGKSLNIEALRLFPSPRTSDTNGAGAHGTGGPDLRTVASLLPTPRAQHGEPRNQNIYYRPADQPQNLENALYHVTKDGHAHTAEASASEELRDVRDADGAEAVREAPRGLGCVPATSSLLPVMREHTHGGDEGRAPLAGQEAQGDGVRGVCHDCGPACASQRPEPREQRPIEPDDALRELSPAAALAGGSRCPYGCGETCSGHSTVEWGEYEAAIRRWEVCLGRPAPDPTQPGAKGQPRLSAHFCEWLMGLPEGHVTDVPGISRNDQLKALGNGVVPQQAAAATWAFINDTAKENAA